MQFLCPVPRSHAQADRDGNYVCHVAVFVVVRQWFGFLFSLRYDSGSDILLLRNGKNPAVVVVDASPPYLNYVWKV